MNARALAAGVAVAALVGGALLWLRPWEDGLPSTIEGCPDPACRAAWVGQAFERDPAEAAAAIGAVEDPVERVVLVTRLTENNLGQTAALCELLPDGPSRSRCETLNRRPHLWVELPDVPVAADRRAGGGPTSTILPVPEELVSAYADEAPRKLECDRQPDPSACVSQIARRQARSGSFRLAARACTSVGTETLRAECLFSSAEVAVTGRGADAYEGAVELCLASGGFASNCLAHTLSLLGQIGVDSTHGDPDDWVPLRQGALAIRRRWEADYPEVSALYEQRFWSDAMALAYGASPVVSGGPIAGVPEIALPHVRAGAATRLIELEGVAGRSLDELVAAVETALTLRIAEPPRIDPPHLFQGVRDLWPEDLSGEDRFPAVLFLGTGRRAVSDDPKVDLAICLLEALGRRSCAPPPGGEAESAAVRATIEQGLDHPDELVQFTARRVLECREPVVPYGPDAGPISEP